MKHLNLLIITLCFVFVLTGCPKSSGTTVKIELEGNMTTGYTWVYTMSPENIIREKSNEYIQTNTGGNIVGAGGTFVFTFESISKGETELVFSYLRVWENDIPAIDTKVYRAIVDEKNNLTLLQE